jgi:hypothetical protein
MTIVECCWMPASRVLVTRLQGTLGPDDARRWMGTLERALAKIEDGGWFKLVVEHGYEVGPCTHGCDGMRSLLAICERRRIRCVAIAHVHDGPARIEGLPRIGQANERFFTDAANAERWIASVSG